jgi:general stress protein YciG
MKTPKEYYYTYYSYEEWGRGYIGSRGCYCLPEEDIRYFGSFGDKTFKPTQKIILKSDYSTREEALADEIILHDFYDVANNSHFANRAKATSTKFFLSKEQSREIGLKCKLNGTGIFAQTPEERKELGRRNGLKTKENGTGVFSLTPEKRREISRKAGSKSKELGNGMFSLSKEQRSENSRKSGLKCKENGTGIFSLTPEQQSERSRKGGKRVQELGRGIHGRTKEQKTEDCKKGGSVAAKIINAQRWECLETGFITNAGNLAQYQRARGIDTSKRKRIS